MERKSSLKPSGPCVGSALRTRPYTEEKVQLPTMRGATAFHSVDQWLQCQCSAPAMPSAVIFEAFRCSWGYLHQAELQPTATIQAVLAWCMLVLLT